MVEHGQTGWIFDGSVDDLHETLTSVITDSAALGLARRECRKAAIERFSTDVSARRLGHIYGEIMSKSLR